MKQFLLWLPLLCLTITNCKTKANTTEKEELPEEVPVIRLEPTDTFLQKRYVARIEAIKNVEIRNKVEGYLDNIYVDEGQKVKKGQLLFAINTDEFKSAVSKAEAGLSNATAEAKTAEVQLNRVRLLVAKNIISPTELEVAQADYNSKLARIAEARSLLETAKTHLAYSFIRAPFDGIIDRIPFKAGSLLTVGSLLTSVSDISAVYAYFNIAEDEYLRYLRDGSKTQGPSGNTVELNLADGTHYPQTGKIETTSSEFEGTTGSIAFRARFPNPNKILRHGASGEVVLNTRVNDVLLLPQKSAFEIQDRNYVYVVDASNRIKMRSFLPQSRIAGFYLVKSGLKAGDRVVYEGTQNLKDGITIHPKVQDMNELLRQEEEQPAAFAQTNQR